MLLKDAQSAYSRRDLAELCENCFFGCVSLSHGTFGVSSSLKLIGKWIFFGTGVLEISVSGSFEKKLRELLLQVQASFLC